LRVVRLLRQRTLGNSSSAVTKVIEEQHGEKYATSLESYFSNCKTFQSSAQRSFFTIPEPLELRTKKITNKLAGIFYFSLLATIQLNLDASKSPGLTIPARAIGISKHPKVVF